MIFLFVPGVAGGALWVNLRFYLFASGVIQVERERGDESKISFFYPRGFPSDLPRARWTSLECLQCLEMINPMVIDFCATAGPNC